MSAEPGITVNEGKYLKFIYRKQHEEFGRVRTTVMAGSVGVRPATVTEMLQKLAEKGLLKYIRYHGVELTEKGLLEARRLLRKHRLLEILLVNFVGHNVQEACQEASRFDYYTSRNLIDKICKAYGHPRTCPCGNPIPRGRECCRETEKMDGAMKNW